MAFASKIFNASFAREASGTILRSQQTQLQLLRDRLNQIAAQTRAETIVNLQNQGAMQRTGIQQEGLNFRNALSAVSSAQRQEAGFLNTQRSDSAGLGIDPAGMQSVELLERISQRNLEIEAEDDEITMALLLREQREDALKFQSENDMILDPDTLDNPEKFAVFQQTYAEKLAREALGESASFKLDSNVMNMIVAMGAEGADLIDGMYLEAKQNNIPIDPETDFRMVVTKANSLNGENVVSGEMNALRIIDAMDHTIISQTFIGGNIPSGLDAQMDENFEANMANVVEQLEAKHNDPSFNAMIFGIAQKTVAELLGPSLINAESMTRTVNNVATLRADQEVSDARADILRDQADPRPAQVEQFELSVSNTVQRILQGDPEALPPLPPAADPIATLQNYVQNVLTFSMNSVGKIQGLDFLEQEDYQAQIEKIQALIQELLSSPTGGIPGIVR